MEQSSFETLEALASLLAEKILVDFRSSCSGRLNQDLSTWHVRISLEKPTAVPFADCPIVELMVRGEDVMGQERV
jgi:hypothetical protein